MRTLKAFASVAVVMVVFDLIFLGYLATDFYDSRLGPLRGETIVWAAALFYLQYVAVITWYAVLPSTSVKQAAIRGLGIGWVAYATYELTNMAVIAGWPAELIPYDIAWGLVLTTGVSSISWMITGAPAEVSDAALSSPARKID